MSFPQALVAVVAALHLASVLRARRRARRRVGPLGPAAPSVLGLMSRLGERWGHGVLGSGRPDRDALPSLVEEIARALRSGRSVAPAIGDAALGGVSCHHMSLREVAARVAAGEGVPEALRWWARASEDEEVGLVVAALTLGMETGGHRARALSGVAGTLHERRAIDAEIRALSSQARSSAVVLVVAPAAFTAVVALVEPDVARFLVGSPLGLTCLALGVGLDCVGAIWMARLMGARS